MALRVAVAVASTGATGATWQTMTSPPLAGAWSLFIACNSSAYRNIMATRQRGNAVGHEVDEACEMQLKWAKKKTKVKTLSLQP